MHSKVAVTSSDEKPKLAFPDALCEGGVDVRFVSGTTVSIAQVYGAGEASTFPAASFARTQNVWDPSASPVRSRGLAHAVQAPVSSLQSNVAPTSFDEKLKLALAVFERTGGVAVKLVSGMAVSTVHVYDAGDASVLPAGSFARTS